MDITNLEVGERINALRKRRGYSREKLSELADISVQFLADIEKGRKSMTIPTLRRIAAALNVTTDFIVNGTEENTDNSHIITMLSSLSERQKAYAEKLLAVFAEAISKEE